MGVMATWRIHVVVVVAVAMVWVPTGGIEEQDVITIDGHSIIRQVPQVTRTFHVKLNAGLVVKPEKNTTTPSSSILLAS